MNKGAGTGECTNSAANLVSAQRHRRHPQSPVAGTSVLGYYISDEEREQHIKIFGERMEAAMARWKAYGCAEDRAEADKMRTLMETAIKARSPAQVARMEAERGLA